jgi:hypothetical protein
MTILVQSRSDAVLAAMWHAYRASRSALRDQVAANPGVERALLNARYYDGGRGQFLSKTQFSLVQAKICRTRSHSTATRIQMIIRLPEASQR